MSNADLWGRQLETGLRDDFDATVVDSRFGTDSRFQNGEQMLLIWTLNGTDADGAPFEDEHFIGVGKAWVTHDGGRSITHESGKDRFFNQNSIYGTIIGRAVSEFGMKDLLTARGGPMEASVWKGLRFHFKSEEKDYGGDIGKKSRVLPNKFLGEDGGSPGQSSGSTASVVSGAEAPVAPSAPLQDPVTSPVQAAPVVGNGSGSGQGDGLRDQVLALARSLPTHSEFQDAAMELPGILDRQDLVEEIVQPEKLYVPARQG